MNALNGSALTRDLSVETPRTTAKKLATICVLVGAFLYQMRFFRTTLPEQDKVCAGITGHVGGIVRSSYCCSPNDLRSRE